MPTETEYDELLSEYSKEIFDNAILRSLIVVTYCEGVKSDFPQANVWMDNIIKLARGE